MSPSRRPWTTQELDALRRLYPDLKAQDLARRLDRSVTAIHAMAAKLGLGKSEAFKASDLSGRTRRGRTNPAMAATQFQPGQAPWNKGRTGWQAGGRSQATQFKPGSKPHTTQPIGAYRITRSHGSAQLEQKTSERQGANHMRWTPVARLVWQAAHGPVPEGHIVVFRNPRLRTTVLEQITLDRLECITRAENARRNHPRNKSPELARLVQLKGAITRQVNRITREAEQAEEQAA